MAIQTCGDNSEIRNIRYSCIEIVCFTLIFSNRKTHLGFFKERKWRFTVFFPVMSVQHWCYITWCTTIWLDTRYAFFTKELGKYICLLLTYNTAETYSPNFVLYTYMRRNSIWNYTIFNTNIFTFIINHQIYPVCHKNINMLEAMRSEET